MPQVFATVFHLIGESFAAISVNCQSVQQVGARTRECDGGELEDSASGARHRVRIDAPNVAIQSHRVPSPLQSNHC